MGITYYGGGGGAGGGSDVLTPHSEVLGSGATWHWPLVSDGVESVTGGAPVDLTGTLVFDETSPGATAVLNADKSTSPATGSIGAAVQYHDAITVACWIKRTGTSTANLAIVGPRTTGGGEALNFPWLLDFTYADNKLRAFWQTGAKSGQEVASTVALALNTWEHWTMTRNTAGTTAKLYKNGILDATSGVLTKGTGGTSQNIIQIAQVNGNEFVGSVFSPIVYKEEMDAAGVLALYNSTSSSGEW